jgi:glycosyltransferase involved in cell wall biosynthesis
VASAVGQIAEVLEDGVSGVLVPPEEPRALSAALVRLVDDGALRARLGRRGRELAAERFDVRQSALRIAQIVAPKELVA